MFSVPPTMPDNAPAPTVYVFFVNVAPGPSRDGPEPLPSLASAPSSESVKLPPLLTHILALLDKTLPRKGEWIAAKLKSTYSAKIKGCNSTIRSALSTLVMFGYAQHAKGEGYVLGPVAAPLSSSSSLERHHESA